MSTIRQRLTRRLLFGWALLLAIGGVAAYGILRSALTRQFDDALRTRAVALASAVEQDQGHVTVDTSDQLVRDFDASKSVYFQIWNPDGTIVARSPSLGRGELPMHYNTFERPVWENAKLADGIQVRTVGMELRPHPATDTGDQSAPVKAILVVAADRRDLNRSLATLAITLAGSGLLVLALTATTVPRLLRRELQPLDQMADQAQRITAESLTERFPTEKLPGELAPISARLNDLLQRLETSFKRERQFSDDLAHELRTPISELRSLVEMALKWPDTRGGETDRSVLAIALQMESIVDGLLAIARGEHGRASVERQQIPLREFVAAIYQPLRPAAASRKLSIEIEIPSDLVINSDEVLLRSIVSNLLENAVEYSAPGVVRICADFRNGRFALRVSNPVENLTSEDIPHLFERFWRKDPARTGAEHAGLGLALARALAASLGYTLVAELGSDARLTMTLSGPTNVETTRLQDIAKIIPAGDKPPTAKRKEPVRHL
jgi:two-component system sensor histidine kinase QseC